MIYNCMILLVFYIRIGGAGDGKTLPKSQTPLDILLEDGD